MSRLKGIFKVSYWTNWRPMVPQLAIRYSFSLHLNICDSDRSFICHYLFEIVCVITTISVISLTSRGKGHIITPWSQHLHDQCPVFYHLFLLLQFQVTFISWPIVSEVEEVGSPFTHPPLPYLKIHSIVTLLLVISVFPKVAAVEHYSHKHAQWNSFKGQLRSESTAHLIVTHMLLSYWKLWGALRKETWLTF